MAPEASRVRIELPCVVLDRSLPLPLSSILFSILQFRQYKRPFIQATLETDETVFNNETSLWLSLNGKSLKGLVFYISLQNDETDLGCLLV